MNRDNALKLFHDLTNVAITSPFGYRDAVYNSKGVLLSSAGFHDGVDYGSKGNSIPIYAVEDGIVLSEGMDNSGAIFCYVSYPRLGYVGLYYHLMCTYISKGDKVTKETRLGMTGTTGLSSGIHLHFGWFKYSEYSKALRSRNYEDYNVYKFPEYTIGTPIARNENVDQIEVKVDSLNARNTPNGERVAYINKGVYNIISSEKSGDYTWYQVENNIWIAYNESWETIYSRKETELEKAKRENAELKNRVTEQDKQIIDLQTQLNSYVEIKAYIKK